MGGVFLVFSAPSQVRAFLFSFQEVFFLFPFWRVHRFQRRLIVHWFTPYRGLAPMRRPDLDFLRRILLALVALASPGAEVPFTFECGFLQVPVGVLVLSGLFSRPRSSPAHFPIPVRPCASRISSPLPCRGPCAIGVYAASRSSAVRSPVAKSRRRRVCELGPRGSRSGCAPPTLWLFCDEIRSHRNSSFAL
ncbi:hypothetical protein DFH07DRAFT_356338 [Mycena maculata]|uniref:Uncharacterized protein n=1 Tax=Mycena maculata TaxID=230809 RepID=A0AAD7HAN0_9AGAR|nr:hypothetical protein DFH07DRAFT_356338 [Mycena maculata]